MSNWRMIIALSSLILIGILWMAAIGAFANPSTSEYGRIGAGILMVAFGVHLIYFRNENATLWRRENRSMWRQSFISNLLEQQYTPTVISFLGLATLLFGIVFLLVGR